MDLYLSAAQWRLVAPFLTKKEGEAGPKLKYSLQLLFEGVLYITRTGAQWRSLPHCYPPWHAVFHHMRRWQRTGALAQCLSALNEQARLANNRTKTPSLGILDSQSARNLLPGAREAIGFDGNKKVKGRKRQVLVDVLGLLHGVFIHAANGHDSKGCAELVGDLAANKTLMATLVAVTMDKGYKGDAVELFEGLGLGVIVPEQGIPAESGFVPEPKRWIVEQVFGSILCYWRRLSLDWERTIQSSTAFVNLAFIVKAVKLACSAPKVRFRQ